LRRWVATSPQSQVNEGLAQVGPQAVPWLVKGMQTPDSAFYKLKAAAWKTLPRNLQMQWKNHQPIQPAMLRAQCASALRMLGPEGVSAVPELIQAAQTKRDLYVQAVAIQALAETASDSPQAMAALLRFLREGDNLLRSQVVIAYWASDLKPREALPILFTQLEHYERGPSTTDKPLNEMLAISRYGPEASAAGPLLIQYITRGEGWGNVLNALKGIGPGAAPAVPRLLELLNGSDKSAGAASIRQMKPLIFQVFKNIGPGASAALPALTNGLHDANGVVRALCAAGIGNITGDHEFAVPLLVQELENRNFGDDHHSLSINRRTAGELGLNQRQTAAMLLGEIGPPASNALPNLERSLKSGDVWLPVFAAEAIWKISSDAKTILPTLMASLKHKDGGRRILALQALGSIGPAAENAIPAIRDAMTTDMKTRREAIDALKKIEKRSTESAR
jgi:HEAT repeat protein